MQELLNIAKSRSCTPQNEFRNTGTAEAIQLLQKWNLMELENIFREHDITLRSFIYLTEYEICELIPKIGLRTIFRALLKEWREMSSNYSDGHSKATTSEFEDNDSFLEQIELKTEYKSAFEYSSNTLQTAPEMQLSLHDENNNEALSLITKANLTPSQIIKPPKPLSGQQFIVHDILNRSSDGHAVLEFYKMHTFLDIKNRKRLVNLLIRKVVERRIDKYTAIFHDMTRQILELFPNEKYETYFVPHSGHQSARGALYYRYSNFTRQLRKEGLLGYKKNIANKL